MNIPGIISTLYRPLQPAVRASDENVHYRELTPDSRLQPLIHCYWELKTTKPLPAPFHYRVVADGCIDVLFEPGRCDESFVMGFCRNYTEFPLFNTFRYVGIRFLPAMFSQLFRLKASELTNCFEPLQIVFPKAGKFLYEHIHAGHELEHIKLILDRYFLKLACDCPCDPDNRLYEALEIILKQRGQLKTAAFSDVGISVRQLRRLFDFYIGDAPKAFSQIVRFQNLLRLAPTAETLRKNRVFFDSGYFDQSHFIKEFKTFYGLTPLQAFTR